MNAGNRLGQTAAYLAPHWVQYQQLSVAVDDLGFLQAATAVERLRTYRRRPFETAQHLRRFLHTTTALSIGGLPDPLRLSSLVDELLVRNAAWLKQQGEVGITLFATPGRSGAGDAPTLGLHLSPLDPQAIAQRQRSGQPLVISEVRHPSPLSWPRDIKVRCRLHFYLADLDAHRRDADALGILRDDDGSLTETSIANLAVVRDGQIGSPPADRILPGVTQAIAMRLAAAAGIPWQQRPLSVEDLIEADEILLLGTTTGIWPGYLLGHSGNSSAVAPDRRGPIGVALQAALQAAVG